MFNWNDTFSVKIEAIDEQHKRLFDIGNSINTLLVDHNGYDSYDEIIEQIGNLATYTKIHFKAEEKMMEEYGYKDLDNHIDEHNKFLEYLDDLDFDAIDDNQQGTLSDLIAFIANWIVTHINDTDMQYSEFLAQKLG